MTRAIKLTNDRSKIFSSRRTLAFAAFGLLGVLSAAQVAAQSEPFRIGAVYAVTGPASFLGDAEAKAARLAVDQVNAAGGIKGRKVELILEDSKSQETAAVLSVRKLITQDKVSVILGPSRTGDAMAAIPIVNEAGIVMLPPVQALAWRSTPSSTTGKPSVAMAR